MVDLRKNSTTPAARPTRSFVRLNDSDQARVEAVAVALGETPAAVRTMAFLKGLEALESQVLEARGNGSENAMGIASETGQKKPLGYPWMSESERAGLEARIDDLEARISGVSEAGLGSLAMLSMVLERCMESTRSEGQEEG